MGDFGKFLVKAFVRKGLTALGAFLLAYGVLTEEESAGFVGRYLEEACGGVLLLASSLWTYVYQKYVKEKVVTALKLPADSSTEKLAAVMGEKEG